MTDGVLVIDKPAGMTSFDVIARLRKQYGQKKFGHTGTLDPEATGVLVILAGKAAKALPYLTNTDKAYEAEIELGRFTDTEDIWGKTLEEKPVNRDFDFGAELARFKGKQTQKIPLTSAKKYQGKKLIDYQREGKEVPDFYKDVEIYDIVPLDEKELKFAVECSGGTFVRTICQDLAAHTGNAGCLKSLRRTAASGFTLEDADPLEGPHRIHTLKELLKDWPMMEADNPDDVFSGRQIELDTQEPVVCVTVDGEPAAMYEKRGDRYASKRGLF